MSNERPPDKLNTLLARIVVALGACVLLSAAAVAYLWLRPASEAQGVRQIAYAAIGIISAAFIIVFKRGDPVNWVVSSLSILLGGVFFPYTVLPGWMQFFSRLLPMTWSLDGIRSALLKGAGFASLWREFLALAVIAAILVPTSLTLFALAVRHARRVGSLVKY